MATYSGSITTLVTASGVTLAAEIRAAAIARPRVAELGLFQTTTITSQAYYIGRSSSVGVTPYNPITVIPNDPNDPVGTTQLANAWATVPGTPTIYLRRYDPDIYIGSGVTFSFPRGLVIEPSTSLAIVINQAAPIIVSVVVGE